MPFELGEHVRIARQPEHRGRIIERRTSPDGRMRTYLFECDRCQCFHRADEEDLIRQIRFAVGDRVTIARDLIDRGHIGRIARDTTPADRRVWDYFFACETCSMTHAVYDADLEATMPMIEVGALVRVVDVDRNVFRSMVIGHVGRVIEQTVTGVTVQERMYTIECETCPLVGGRSVQTHWLRESDLCVLSDSAEPVTMYTSGPTYDTMATGVYYSTGATAGIFPTEDAVFPSAAIARIGNAFRSVGHSVSGMVRPMQDAAAAIDRFGDAARRSKKPKRSASPQPTEPRPVRKLRTVRKEDTS